MSKRTSLIIGEVFASSDDVEVSTVVGSCVTVCLYDPVARCGGMNHFLLPTRSCSTFASHGSYGDTAMPLLLAALQAENAQMHQLQAKVFGAANALRMSHAAATVGEQNRAFALAFLEARGIPIVAMHMGGQQGLNVHFFCRTGQAYVRPVDPGLSLELASQQEVRT